MDMAKPIVDELARLERGIVAFDTLAQNKVSWGSLTRCGR